MADLIVFKVQDNLYAMDIEHIQRITQAKSLTPIPNAHPFIDGMMSHEERILKVVNFRKMVGVESYDAQLSTLFASLKGQHKEWVDALNYAVSNKTHFQKTTNPHECELGKWLDSFTSYDDHVTQILKGLNENHKLLHNCGGEIVAMQEDNPEAAQKMADVEVHGYFQKTMGAVDTFMSEFDVVADSLQKLLIYNNGVDTFAIKVDEIVDIAHIEAENIKESENTNKVSQFLELQGVIELEENLINVIKEVSLPQEME